MRVEEIEEREMFLKNGKTSFLSMRPGSSNSSQTSANNNPKPKHKSRRNSVLIKIMQNNRTQEKELKEEADKVKHP